MRLSSTGCTFELNYGIEPKLERSHSVSLSLCLALILSLCLSLTLHLALTLSRSYTLPLARSCFVALSRFVSALLPSILSRSVSPIAPCSHNSCFRLHLSSAALAHTRRGCCRLFATASPASRPRSCSALSSTRRQTSVVVCCYIGHSGRRTCEPTTRDQAMTNPLSTNAATKHATTDIPCKFLLLQFLVQLMDSDTCS